MSSHAQIGPQEAEKQQMKANVGDGVVRGQKLKQLLLIKELSSEQSL